MVKGNDDTVVFKQHNCNKSVAILVIYNKSVGQNTMVDYKIIARKLGVTKNRLVDLKYSADQNKLTFQYLKPGAENITNCMIIIYSVMIQY